MAIRSGWGRANKARLRRAGAIRRARKTEEHTAERNSAGPWPAHRRVRPLGGAPDGTVVSVSANIKLPIPVGSIDSPSLTGGGGTQHLAGKKIGLPRMKGRPIDGSSSLHFGNRVSPIYGRRLRLCEPHLSARQPLSVCFPRRL